MSRKNLSNKPKHIGPGLWYYEENGGFELYGNQGWVGHIPSRNIREYIKRKDKRS